MYELIMDLPLFKGISPRLVSDFLETTNVGFENYHDREKIAGKGESCGYLKFVISGKVIVSGPAVGQIPALSYRLGAPFVIGVERLFGLETGYLHDVTACGDVSVMQFDKKQYTDILASDPIYIINLLNYLSVRAQRPVLCLHRFTDGSASGLLTLLIAGLAEPGAYDIRVENGVRSLARMLNRRIDRIISELSGEKIGEVVSIRDGDVYVRSRHSLMDLSDD